MVVNVYMVSFVGNENVLALAGETQWIEHGL